MGCPPTNGQRVRGAVLVFATGPDRLTVVKPDSTGGLVAPDDPVYAVAKGDMS